MVGLLAGWINSSITLACFHACMSAAALLLPPSPYELARAGDREGVGAVLAGLREGGEQEVNQELEKIFK